MNILEPTRGSATLLGVDSRKISPRELAQIGYVSENQDMPSRLTVEEYTRYLRPFYPTWDRDLEASIARQLRLPLGRKIGDLSHGMRMKMALMCALPYRPKLLVLDEPFSGLDPLVRDEFMEGLLNQAGEMTILISSHELGEIDGVATHIAFMDDGKLLFQESMGELTNGSAKCMWCSMAKPRSRPRLPTNGWSCARWETCSRSLTRSSMNAICASEFIRELAMCATSTCSRCRCAPFLQHWRGRHGTAPHEEKGRRRWSGTFSRRLEATVGLCDHDCVASWIAAFIRFQAWPLQRRRVA